MVVVDTNIIIDHLRRGVRKSALVKLEAKMPDEKLLISMITIQELYEGRSVDDAGAEKDMLATLAGLEILPFGYEEAKRAGELNRYLSLEDKIESADAAIAATCMVNDCKLATLDKKDFAGIEGLEMVEI